MLQKRAFTVTTALLISSVAQAQSAGDFVVNLGWFHIAPQDSSKPLRSMHSAPV